jgi:hypothetical protein
LDLQYLAALSSAFMFSAATHSRSIASHSVYVIQKSTWLQDVSHEVKMPARLAGTQGSTHANALQPKPLQGIALRSWLPG